MNVLNVLWDWLATVRSFLLGRGIDEVVDEGEFQRRRKHYRALWSHYLETTYNSRIDGGIKEDIIKRLGNASSSDLESFYSSFARIADFYRDYVFGGEWGDVMKIDPEVEDGGKAVNPKITGPVGDIWKWSGLNSECQRLALTGAVTGNCGLRIDVKPSPLPDQDPAAVFHPATIQVRDPQEIIDFELEDDGRVREVALEYTQIEGDLEDIARPNALGFRRAHVYREFLSDGYFKAWRDNRPWDRVTKKPVGDTFQRPNPLGLCPYVILRHSNVGSQFSPGPFDGSLWRVHRINALIAHATIQIHRTVRSKWWVFGSGKAAPTAKDMGDMTLWYTQQSGVEQHPTSIHSLVNRLDFAGTLGIIRFLVDLHEAEHPELRASNDKLLANLSGSALERFMAPASSKVRAVRPNYDAAVVQAMKLALSWGAYAGWFDLGVGRDPATIRRAYIDGTFDFRFAERDYLPLTQAERDQRRLTSSQAEQAETSAAQSVAELTDPQTTLIYMGYEPKKEIGLAVEDIMARREKIAADADAKAQSDAKAAADAAVQKAAAQPPPTPAPAMNGSAA